MGEFLSVLPEELRRNWILMNETESAQPAPRILLQSKDGKQLLSYSLKKDANGDYVDDSVEMIEWNEQTKGFDFRLFDFSGDQVRVDKNPQSCVVCHQGRPNWDPYDNWANMLPFNRDRLYEGSEEELALRRFLEDNAQDERFGSMVLPPGVKVSEGENGPVAEFVFGRKDPQAETEYEGEKYSHGGSYLLFDHECKRGDEGRGVALFDNLTVLNGQRIAESLKRHPRFDRFKYALLAMLTNIGSAIPEVRCFEGKSLAAGAAEGSVSVGDKQISGDELPSATPPKKIIVPEGASFEDPFLKAEAIKDELKSSAITIEEGVGSSAISSTSTEAVKTPLGGLGRRAGSGACLNDRQQFDSFIPKKILTARDSSGKSLEEYVTETGESRKQMPAARIRMQRRVFARMILRRAEEEGLTLTAEELDRRVNEEMLRRNPRGFETHEGFIVDRETYFENELIGKIRYLLEPEGVDMASWSLSVSERSSTYTFGDLFSSTVLPSIKRMLLDDLEAAGIAADCATLEKKSYSAYQSRVPIEAPRPGKETSVEQNH